MTSREKFEQAIKARFGDLIDYRVCKNSDGEYMDWDMQVAWWAWQAAETDMAVQLTNAESKCRALAAENGGLKAICDDRRMFIMNGVQLGYIQVPTVETDPALETIRVAVSPQEPTPATDAFLAEVRAQGVDMFALMFAEEAIKSNNITTGWRAKASRAASEYAEALREDAAQLRKGAAL